MKLYLDTEGIGLQAETLLIQYSRDKEPVQYMNLWDQDYSKLMWLYDEMYNPDSILIGYNLYFDAYKLYQLFHEKIFRKSLKSYERVVPPFKIQFLDLMNHAQYKSVLAPYAFLKNANASIAKVKEIPEEIKDIVKETVFRNLDLPKAVQLACSEQDTKREGLVTLAFYIKNHISLKNLMKEYGFETIKIQDVWTVPNFKEKEYLPYSEDLKEYELIRMQNYQVLKDQDSLFWKYAQNDIIYLWELEKRLNNPIPDFNDSCIACNSYLRYFGVPIDIEQAEFLNDLYTDRLETIQVKGEGLNLDSQTGKADYMRRNGNKYVEIGSKAEAWKLHMFAQKQDRIGIAAKELTDYSSLSIHSKNLIKMLESETHRFHPILNTVGTATGRMTGGSSRNEFENSSWSINPQGIGAERPEGIEMNIRDVLLMSQGGDFDAFEIAIAASVYKDKQMLEDLDKDIDVHIQAYRSFHEEQDYNNFVKNKKKEPFHSWRGKGKRLNFSIIYGASFPKIMEIMGCSEVQAKEGLDKYFKKYSGIDDFRKNLEQGFMTADTETWSKDCIEEMREYTQDIFGTKRYFTFEKQICSLFWSLGQRNLLSDKDLGSKIVLRKEMKGEQTYNNALKSAFLGSAITIQQAIFRQAGNTPIQMTGATITKKLMEALWKEYAIPLFNVHDELNVPAGFESQYSQISDFVVNFIEEYKSKIKHLSMDWEELKTWGDKDTYGVEIPF